jgi:hypothetical protein
MRQLAQVPKARACGRLNLTFFDVEARISCIAEHFDLLFKLIPPIQYLVKKKLLKLPA